MTQNVPPKSGPAGDLAVSITNPNSAVGGIYATLTAFGSLNVALDALNVFAEPFDGVTVDTTNRWTLTGTVPASQTNGNMTVNPGATASATTALTSQPSFTFVGAYSLGAVLAIESTIATGNHRFWGFGTPPTPPGTSAAPLQDAIGFEIDTAGALRASIYVSGTRSFTQVLTIPTDGLTHRYVCTVRGDIAMWYRDSFDLPAAQASVPGMTQILPLRLASLNSGSVTGTPTLSVVGLAVLDHSRNFTQIADGTYPWRKIKVDQYGAQNVALQGQPSTAVPTRPDSYLRIAPDPSALFFDTFDSGYDTTDRWTTAGTAPTALNGTLTVDAATTALAVSSTTSKPTFPLLGNMFNQTVFVTKIDAAAKTGNLRFFGQGVPAGSPTSTVPYVNAVGFQLDPTTGALAGVVWSASAQTQTVALTRPTDGSWHRYAMFYKTSRVYFEIDGVVGGSIAYPAPNVSNLPVSVMSVNGASTVSPTATLQFTFAGLADTSNNNVVLSDGTFPWRKGTISKFGAQYTNPGPSLLAAYSGISEATFTLVANTRKDALSIEHSAAATKIVKIRRITVAAYNTTAVTGYVYAKIFYGTAATSAGTVATATKMNEAAAAAEAVVKTNPTITAATQKFTAGIGLLAATTGAGVGPVTIYDATSGSDMDALTLRAGVLETITVAVYSTGANALQPLINIYFTEE